MESLAGPVTQILWKPQRFASPLCFCPQGCLFCTTNYILVGVKPLIWSTPPPKKKQISYCKCELRWSTGCAGRGRDRKKSVLTCDLDDSTHNSDHGSDNLPLLPVLVRGCHCGDAPIPLGACTSSIPWLLGSVTWVMGSAQECHPGTLLPGCCQFC